MPPIPATCQPLADQVATLKQQYQAKATEAAGLVGAPAWVALGELGLIRMQLGDAVSALAQCISTHSAAVTGAVAVIDVSGGAAAASGQTVTLWDVATAPTPVEVATVQNGAFGFQSGVPAKAALTLQTIAADGGGAGGSIDFRSGELSPGEATPRIEVVVLPTLSLSAATLTRWAAAFQPVTQQSSLTQTAGPLGAGSATITSVAVQLAAGTVTLTAIGTVDATALIGSLSVPIASALPFTAAITVTLVPSSSPAGAEIATVSLAGDNPINLSLPDNAGIVVGMLSVLRGVLSPIAAGIVQQELSDWLHQALPEQIASGLALAGLPADTRISLRSLTIDERGITFQPVLGVIGDGLSTYQPQPLPIPT